MVFMISHCNKKVVYEYIPCVSSNNIAVVVVICPVRPVRVTAAEEVGNGTDVLVLERRSVEHGVTTNGNLVLIVEPL